MKVSIEIDCDPDVELVAKALYANNSYPGRQIDKIQWPPSKRATLMHYINLGKAVIAAQRRRP